MKKLILTAVACMVFSSCGKTEPETVTPSTPVSGTAFDKGRTITLTVNTGSATKVISELNGDGKTVNFRWASGDKIKVTVAGKEAEFTLKSGAGASSAVFEGVMPASGDQFDVQYPVTDPDIATQAYSSNEAIPHDMMKFTAAGCTTASPNITLKAAYAALRLNLWGTDQTISKIKIKDESSNTYTLNINPTVILPATEAKPKAFLIVVPAGSYRFSAEVFDNAEPPASICKFETTAAKTFTAGAVLNMPAKEVKAAD